MKPPLAAFLVSGWLLGIGLYAVHLEVRNVQRGLAIRHLLEEEAAAVERVRALELRYQELIRPDHLERTLPEELREPRRMSAERPFTLATLMD